MILIYDHVHNIYMPHQVWDWYVDLGFWNLFLYIVSCQESILKLDIDDKNAMYILAVKGTQVACLNWNLQ